MADLQEADEAFINMVTTAQPPSAEEGKKPQTEPSAVGDNCHSEKVASDCQNIVVTMVNSPGTANSSYETPNVGRSLSPNNDNCGDVNAQQIKVTGKLNRLASSDPSPCAPVSSLRCPVSSVNRQSSETCHSSEEDETVAAAAAQGEHSVEAPPISPPIPQLASKMEVSPGDFSVIKLELYILRLCADAFNCHLCLKRFPNYRSFMKHMESHGFPAQFDLASLWKAAQVWGSLQSVPVALPSQRPASSSSFTLPTSAPKAGVNRRSEEEYDSFIAKVRKKKCEATGTEQRSKNGPLVTISTPIEQHRVVLISTPIDKKPIEKNRVESRQTLDSIPPISVSESENGGGNSDNSNRGDGGEVVGGTDNSGDIVGEGVVTKVNAALIQHKCKCCDAEFPTREQLDDHLRNFVHECKTCGKRYTHAGSFMRHRSSHVNPSRFVCIECGRGFSRRYLLQDHMRLHTGDTSYKCETCHTTLNSKKSLQQHQLVHTATGRPRPYKCQECSKTFCSRGILDIHERSHTGVRPFECPTCKATFVSKGGLVGHEKSHLNVSSFVCTTCGVTLKSRSGLNKHERTVHSDSKPFHCEVCEAGFVVRSQLIIHMRKHTGERPYLCDVCGKGFMTQSLLTVHGSIHSSEKRHQCDQCGAEFSQPSTLKTHMNIHTGEKPFVCTTCSERFAFRASLRSHILSHRKKNA